MHIKTVILPGNFFHLVCVMLLICQQRFLFNGFFTFFIFFIKNAFLTFFILGVNVFRSMSSPRPTCIEWNGFFRQRTSVTHLYQTLKFISLRCGRPIYDYRNGAKLALVQDLFQGAQ